MECPHPSFLKTSYQVAQKFMPSKKEISATRTPVPTTTILGAPLLTVSEFVLIASWHTNRETCFNPSDRGFLQFFVWKIRACVFKQVESCVFYTSSLFLLFRYWDLPNCVCRNTPSCGDQTVAVGPQGQLRSEPTPSSGDVCRLASALRRTLQVEWRVRSLRLHVQHKPLQAVPDDRWLDRWACMLSIRRCLRLSSKCSSEMTPLKMWQFSL